MTKIKVAPFYLGHGVYWSTCTHFYLSVEKCLLFLHMCLLSVELLMLDGVSWWAFVVDSKEDAKV